MSVKKNGTDYATYKEIMAELGKPIEASGLEFETLKRLYESKLVYLENLRQRAFRDLNHPGKQTFSSADYEFILSAIKQSKEHLSQSVMQAIVINLSKSTVKLPSTGS